ncbi:MAG TPA: putative peptide modification system cyclase [Dokdonella sp.]
MPASAAATVPLLRTLVLCDLVDSTALVERLGDQRAAELIRKHDRVVRALLPARGGREIDKTDGFLAMFDRPIQAVAFALDYQRGLRELNANEKTALGARVGIHVGDVLTWENTPDDIAKGAKLTEVEGLVKPITSRLMQLALPGQILLSGVAYSLAHRAQGELGERLATVRWRTHGRYRFKGIPDPIPVFEVGEEGHAPLKPPPWSGKAHREVPFWRRPATVVVEGMLLLALVAIPLWYVFKPAPAIAFANRDWVVVGDLKNLTTDAGFNDSLQAAFRIGLEQSRYVNVQSDLRTRETIKLMQRDPEQTHIDRIVGSEIAIRDGARALILPTVAEIGGRVRVTAEVVDPQTQTTVYSESADGIGEASVLPSLDKVNQQLRVRLGEALATVSNESKPLEKATTKDLEALRAYSLGLKAYATDKNKEALAFFQRATTLDPDFALAHAAIAGIYSNNDQTEAAYREISKAAAAKDKLTTRDALYIEASQALFDAPSTALAKFKLLSELYPDFLTASGLYGYYAWQYGNQYEPAIKALESGNSQQNPNPQVREFILGTLYLGQEAYADALRHFSRAIELGLPRSELQAAAYAAQRRFDKVASTLAQRQPSNVEDEDASSKNLRIAFAADQGHWSDAWNLLQREKADLGPGKPRTARHLRGVEVSLQSMTNPLPGSAGQIGSFLEGEVAALGQEAHIERSETMFHVLFAAYLAAANGDTALARSALAHAGPEMRDGTYPVISRMLAVAQAETERAGGDPAEAVRLLLQQPLDGTELFVTHIALMHAYLAQGDRANALTQAQWLSSHRGRAYTEYNADWFARPFNVVQSDLALLEAAEISLALGNKEQSRRSLAAFRQAWPDSKGVGFVTPRLAKLDAEL